MQKFPEPPKSYSLIENLRPSASLSGQTSEPDLGHPQTQLILRTQIANDLNEMIDTVQTSSIEDLKKAFKKQINELQSFHIQQPQKLSGPLGKIVDSQDLVLSKLKQLALISDILVQRMNEKYSESKTLYEDFCKETLSKKRSIKMKILQWRKKEKVNGRKIDVSQETEKKPVIYDEETLEQLEKEDQKRTRKQDTKVKTKQ